MVCTEKGAVKQGAGGGHGGGSRIYVRSTYKVVSSMFDISSQTGRPATAIARQPVARRGRDPMGMAL